MTGNRRQYSVPVRGHRLDQPVQVGHLVGRRFPPDIAAAVEATEWWEWDHDTLRERLADFRDLETFLSKYAPEPVEVPADLGMGPDGG